MGRNYIGIWRLTPEHDIRFVSVSAAIDTDEGENELAPIRNLFKNIAHSGNVFHCFALIRHGEQTRLQDFAHP